MHTIPLLSLAFALLATTSAFIIPKNQVDGLYQVRRDISGNELHEALAPPSRRDTDSVTAPATNYLEKRGSLGKVHCGCGNTLDHSDTDAAVADLKNQLTSGGSLIANGEAYYSIRGGTVAFVCNSNHNAMLLAWSAEVGHGLAQVTHACGAYVAGSVGGLYGTSIGYMKNSQGLDFCGAALSSPKTHC